MMNNMDDLITFLRARLDDDEKAARAAKPGPWHTDGGSVYATHPTDTVVDYTESAAHIARHDPARVLADIEAKRRIIAQHERYAAERRRMMGGWDPRSDDSPILAALAAVYADHPDYRAEWRP